MSCAKLGIHIQDYYIGMNILESNTLVSKSFEITDPVVQYLQSTQDEIGRSLLIETLEKVVDIEGTVGAQSMLITCQSLYYCIGRCRVENGIN